MRCNLDLQPPAGAGRRIHIVGGAGSGKTLLARRLGLLLNVPVHNLDDVDYEGGAGQEHSLALRLADIRRIAAAPTWVTERVFLGWADDLLRNADIVFWLDLPWRVAAWRIVLRHARASAAGRNRHRGLRKLARFLWWTWGYYHAAGETAHDVPDANRAATARHLASYTAKIVHCRGPRDVARFLDTLAAGRSAKQLTLLANAEPTPYQTSPT